MTLAANPQGAAKTRQGCAPPEVCRRDVLLGVRRLRAARQHFDHPRTNGEQVSEPTEVDFNDLIRAKPESGSERAKRLTAQLAQTHEPEPTTDDDHDHEEQGG